MKKKVTVHIWLTKNTLSGSWLIRRLNLGRDELLPKGWRGYTVNEDDLFIAKEIEIETNDNADIAI